MINLPNSLTFGRLLIAFVSFGLMFLDQWLIAAILLSIAVTMDIADGKLARKLDQVTTQGIFFDVMVDKVVIISTFLVIGIQLNIYFFYLGLLMLLREYAIDTMRSIAASAHTVISADKFSKIKGILFMTAMLGMIWNKVFELKYEPVLQDIFALLAAFAMVLAYITLVRFFLKYRDLILKR